MQPAQSVAQHSDGSDGVMEEEQRLKNFPISFFATILGLTGTTIAFQRAEMILKWPFQVSPIILTLTVFLFFMLLVLYTVKIVLYPEEVKHEARHPVRINFFPTLSISLLLMNIAFHSISDPVSKYLWIIGTILHAIFSLSIMAFWIQHPNFQINHFNAAWFIPVVGNILVPVTGAEHGFLEVSWFFFSIGFIFWIVLLTILFNRLIFHHPLPQKLLPTLFITIAPPAVGFISYVKVNHEHVDNFAIVLYHFALFSFFLMIFQIRMFSKIKFFLSWWAYSFPIAAMTIATLFRLKLIRDCIANDAACPYMPLHVNFYTTLAYGLLAFLTVVISMLVIRTILSVMAREICVVED
jgi:tellurite resistance protein